MTTESGREPRNTEVPGHVSPEKWYARYRRGLWWTIVGVWIAATLILGMWGWHLADSAASLPDNFYNTLQLFWLQGSFDPGRMSLPLNLARYAGAIFLLSTFALAFFALFRTEIRRWRVRRSRRHTIVCGLGLKGFEVVRALRAAGERVVVIQLDAENDFLPAVRSLGVLDLVADATEPKTLAMARLHRATQLLILCDQDHVNVAIAETARGLLKRPNDGGTSGDPQWNPVTCKVLLQDEALWQQLDRLKITEPGWEYFSFLDRAAEWLILAHPPFEAFVNGERSVARVAVVGEGEFARAVCAHLVDVWTKSDEATGPRQLELWCGRAEELREELRFEFSDSAGDESAVTIVPRPEASALGDPSATHPALRKAVPSLEGIGRVYVCLASDHRTVAVSLVIEEMLRARHSRSTHVIACIQSAGAIGHLLSRVSDSRDAEGRPLEVFDMMKALRDPRLLFGDFHEELAGIIDGRYGERNRGAAASLLWDALSDDDRRQSRDQAQAYGRYLRKLGCEVTRGRSLVRGVEFTDDEIEAIAGEEHARWLRLKLEGGWVWGEETNEQVKTNPRVKEWSDLPDELKEETRREIRDIPVVLEEAHFVVFRASAAGLSNET